MDSCRKNLLILICGILLLDGCGSGRPKYGKNASQTYQIPPPIVEESYNKENDFYIGAFKRTFLTIQPHGVDSVFFEIGNLSSRWRSRDGELEQVTVVAGDTIYKNTDEHSTLRFWLDSIHQNEVVITYEAIFSHASFGKGNLITIARGQFKHGWYRVRFVGYEDPHDAVFIHRLTGSDEELARVNAKVSSLFKRDFPTIERLWPDSIVETPKTWEINYMAPKKIFDVQGEFVPDEYTARRHIQKRYVLIKPDLTEPVIGIFPK